MFLYTKYAHQPDERRERQYHACLSEVQEDKNLLTFLFLEELQKANSEIRSAGRTVAWWFDRYCEHHQISPDVLPSLRHDAPGLGSMEKEGARKARLFRERAEDLAVEIWKEKGRPEGEPMQCYPEAKEQLSQALGGGGNEA